jgi:hydroxymethylpyrimidine/phosphomethylpyrimidine kinase
MTPPVVLVIAGSDSGGGAGIQADLHTLAAFGVHGCTAVAALTAQSTTEVRAVLPTPPEFLRAQIETVLDDIDVLAVKTGMLATADNVRVVADLAATGRLPNLVVDPVMVSSTGARLLDAGAEALYRDQLLPRATVVTPNSREAAVLTGLAVEGVVGQSVAAIELVRLGTPYVVVKGGDQAGDEAVDVFVASPEPGATLPRELVAPRVVTRNNHGTGCSFASAVAAGLARGDEPTHAISRAKGYVAGALRRSAGWNLGGGHGPIDHLDLAHPVADRLDDSA